MLKTREGWSVLSLLKLRTLQDTSMNRKFSSYALDRCTYPQQPNSSRRESMFLLQFRRDSIGSWSYNCTTFSSCWWRRLNFFSIFSLVRTSQKVYEIKFLFFNHFISLNLNLQTDYLLLLLLYSIANLKNRMGPESTIQYLISECLSVGAGIATLSS